METEQLRRESMRIFFRIGSRMKTNFTMALQGMPRSEFFALHQIQEQARQQADENVRVQSLVRAFHTPASGVSRTLRVLEQKGYIERMADPGDRRKACVRLTGQGQKALDACFTRFCNSYDMLLQQLGEEKCLQMIAMMQDLEAALEAQNRMLKNEQP